MIAPRASPTTVAFVARVISGVRSPLVRPLAEPGVGAKLRSRLGQKWLCTSEGGVGNARRAASNHNGLALPASVYESLRPLSHQALGLSGTAQR